MAKKKAKKATAKKATAKDHVIVTSKSYGSVLKGTKVYFEGKKPTFLRDDGAFKMGKHILLALREKFDKFQLTIALKDDEIVLKYGIHRVKISLATLRRMETQNWDRAKDIKTDIVSKTFSTVYPAYFTGSVAAPYVPGRIAKIVRPGIVERLSPEDKDALNGFLPDFLSSQAAASVNLLKATTQIKTLKELAKNLEVSLKKDYSESWWQNYIKANILLIQQGYIQAIGKINIAIGNTRYPDFSLITHDNYLDILEIKKPATSLFKHDSSRDNYYWDAEISKAIVQTEKYIEGITRNSDSVRSYIKDEHGIDMKVMRPRGIILAGDTRNFTNTKQRDDFRLLSHSTRNITFLTYDELLNRLNNYIEVLEQYSKKTRDAEKAK